jgi:adenylate kinase
VRLDPARAHISTGELLRSAAKAGTELGLKAKEVIDRGELVSDGLMLGLLEERLSGTDTGRGFILDGYPRNLVQAESLEVLLEKLGRPVDEALQIDVDIDKVVARIAKRAAEEGRSDDTEETVRNRMKVYAEQTAPVVGFYAEKGVLSRVLGDGTIEEVFRRIMGVLQLHSAS